MIFDFKYSPLTLGLVVAIVLPIASTAILLPPANAKLPTAVLVAVSVDLGWTKQQVQRENGKPARKSADGNTWYYNSQGHTSAVHFNSKGRVDSFPGAKG